jgi:hypothetical protein
MYDETPTAAVGVLLWLGGIYLMVSAPTNVAVVVGAFALVVSLVFIGRAYAEPGVIGFVMVTTGFLWLWAALFLGAPS